LFANHLKGGYRVYLARFTRVLDPKEDALTQMCDLVRGKSPMPFAGHMFVGKRVERPFNYEQFFYYNENKVVEAYRFEDVEAATNKVLSDTLGKTVSINLPNIQMNRNGIPEEFRQPAETWLPSDCYEKLKLYFTNDTAFYNSVKPLNE